MMIGLSELAKEIGEIGKKAFSLDEIPQSLGETSGLNEIPEELGEENTDLGQLHENQEYKVNGITYKTDDNGEIYQKGKELLPENSYSLNGYTYKTNENGNVVSTEGQITTDKINQGERKPLNEKMEDIGKGVQKETDDRGHLIGDKLGGDNGLGNLVPQDATLNRGRYSQMEQNLKAAVNDGKEVYVKIDVKYADTTGKNRPTSFIVTSTINGEKTIQRFKNEGGK